MLTLPRAAAGARWGREQGTETITIIQALLLLFSRLALSSSASALLSLSVVEAARSSSDATTSSDKNRVNFAKLSTARRGWDAGRVGPTSADAANESWSSPAGGSPATAAAAAVKGTRLAAFVFCGESESLHAADGSSNSCSGWSLDKRVALSKCFDGGGEVPPQPRADELSGGCSCSLCCSNRGGGQRRHCMRHRSRIGARA